MVSSTMHGDTSCDTQVSGPPPDPRDPFHDSLLATVPCLRDPELGIELRYLTPCLITAKVARGAMGAVFCAWHLTFDMQVAVKCLTPITGPYQDEQAVERFRREARALAAVTHQNLIRVYEYGEGHGLHWLVMEFVQGETVRARVRRKGTLPLDEALTVMICASRGIEASHDAGIIHRDIKPENLLVSQRGELKVADLGLAKPMDRNDNLTMARAMMGTPSYMAPEQWRDSGSVDGRADIYSLGATLYFMLSGRDPYASSSPMEVMKRVATEPFPVLEDQDTHVTPAVAEILHRCTAREADDRYETVGELVEALLDAGAHDRRLLVSGDTLALSNQMPVPPPEVIDSLREQAREIDSDLETRRMTEHLRRSRKRLRIGLAAAVFLCLGLAAVPFSFQSFREAMTGRTAVEEAQDEFFQGMLQAPWDPARGLPPGFPMEMSDPVLLSWIRSHRAADVHAERSLLAWAELECSRRWLRFAASPHEPLTAAQSLQALREAWESLRFAEVARDAATSRNTFVPLEEWEAIDDVRERITDLFTDAFREALSVRSTELVRVGDTWIGRDRIAFDLTLIDPLVVALHVVPEDPRVGSAVTLLGGRGPALWDVRGLNLEGCRFLVEVETRDDTLRPRITLDVALDHQDPRLSVERTSVEGKELRVRGVALDDTAVAGVTLSAPSLGLPEREVQVATTGIFEVVLPIGEREGPVELLVHALDRVGRTTSVERTFVVDSRPPRLEIEQMETAYVDPHEPHSSVARVKVRVQDGSRHELFVQGDACVPDRKGAWEGVVPIRVEEPVIRVRARDEWGNESSRETPIEVRLLPEIEVDPASLEGVHAKGHPLTFTVRAHPEELVEVTLFVTHVLETSRSGKRIELGRVPPGEPRTVPIPLEKGENRVRIVCTHTAERRPVRREARFTLKR